MKFSLTFHRSPFYSSVSQSVFSFTISDSMTVSRQKRKPDSCKLSGIFVSALPIFPVRLQTSIFGRSELNFRVRDGNGWTLALISTNYLLYLHPENRTMYLMRWEKADCLQNFVGQALGLLVPVSCIHYCTSTSGLSTR